MQTGHLKWGFHGYNGAPGYVIVRIEAVFPSWNVFFMSIYFAT